MRCCWIVLCCLVTGCDFTRADLPRVPFTATEGSATVVLRAPLHNCSSSATLTFDDGLGHDEYEGRPAPAWDVQAEVFDGDGRRIWSLNDRMGQWSNWGGASSTYVYTAGGGPELTTMRSYELEVRWSPRVEATQSPATEARRLGEQKRGGKRRGRSSADRGERGEAQPPLPYFQMRCPWALG